MGIIPWLFCAAAGAGTTGRGVEVECKGDGEEVISQIKWTFQDIAYGSDINQKLDIIIPKETTANAIVYIHGGAYLIGNKSQYPSFLADYSVNNVFAAINYRLMNDNNDIRMENILADINNALMKIIELSKENGVIIKNFILVGHSAGGHIALLYSYKNESVINQSSVCKITACISLSGPTDFTDDTGWSSMAMWGEDMETRLSFLSKVGSKLTGYPIKLTQLNWTKQKNYHEFMEYVKDISPITYILKTRKLPPTLIVHARSDNQVQYSNAVKLNFALSQASVSHKLITPAGKGNNHMLGGEFLTDNSPISFGAQSWVSETKKWLETYL
jgi:acetyl esterase/lipase